MQLFFPGESLRPFRQSFNEVTPLRYGENPHQHGYYYGNLSELFHQQNGKELSYNNLVDADAASALVDEFSEAAFAVIKHTNACGVATGASLTEAWKKALAGDPVSAFGGVIATNRKVDLATAAELNKLFFEVHIAPSFDEEALDLLKSKKNRILLQRNATAKNRYQYKTLLNGVIAQEADDKTESEKDLHCVTEKNPSSSEISDLLFALKVVKHLKSNTITLVKNQQLIGMGCGQTSRIDALKQAIMKANEFGFNLKGAVMASDAFFPFPDCIEIAHEAGITSVVQPGGSVKDQDSIDACNRNSISMMFTGIRHFKH